MEPLQVLLPFHANDSFLREAVINLKTTGLKDDQIILIDDRIIDGETAVAPRGISTFGGGYPNALNVGIASSNAEYLAIMNSDDLVKPDRFSQQLNLLITGQGDLCVTGIQKFALVLGFKIQIPTISGEEQLRAYHPCYLLLGPYGANASWMWAEKNNLQFEPGDLSDWHTALKKFRDLKILFIPEKLYLYRQHRKQLTRNATSRTIDFEAIFPAWEKLNAEYGLPKLSVDSAKLLSATWLPKSGKPNVKELITWFKAAQSKDMFDRDLIARKILVLSLKLRSPKLLSLLKVRIIVITFMRLSHAFLVSRVIGKLSR